MTTDGGLQLFFTLVETERLRGERGIHGVGWTPSNKKEHACRRSERVSRVCTARRRVNEQKLIHHHHLNGRGADLNSPCHSLSSSPLSATQPCSHSTQHRWCRKANRSCRSEPRPPTCTARINKQFGLRDRTNEFSIDRVRYRCRFFWNQIFFGCVQLPQNFQIFHHISITSKH